MCPQKKPHEDERETGEEKQKLQAFGVTWSRFSNLGWINTKITKG